MGIAAVTECIHAVWMRKEGSKWMRFLGRALGIVSLIGMLACTYTNLWYFAECMVVFGLYKAITYLVYYAEGRIGKKLDGMDEVKDLGL